MGTIISKEESRRISFDNTFEENHDIQYNIQKSFGDDCLDIVTLEEKEAIDLKNDYKSFPLPDNEQDYWTQRVESLKNEHQHINMIIKSEYENTLESTKMINTPKITQEKMIKFKPCLDWRNKILKCYEDNYYQPLVCSSIVQEFVACVSSCINEDQN